MQPSTRIIVNTLAQYGRTIINILLSLYSTRLVLSILGVEDFGIYSLVAGVVTMLSFITNSLVGSTQRFLSVAQGRGNKEELKSIFSNSVIIHVCLGLIVLVILELLTPALFNGFLNIPLQRVKTASAMYQLVIIMVYLSFIASPYRALLVSRENIVYTSIVDVLDGFLKVIIALLLSTIGHDKLLTYGFLLLSINIFNFFAFAIFCHLKYEECIFPRLKLFTVKFVKQLFSYAGWVIYSTLCIAVRTQGLAVVLNRVLGTKINTAYGIGAQLSGMLSTISTSFTNAVSPQLMAAEGKQDRNQMWFLASMQSKYSFLLLAMFGIPTMFEMSSLLKLWLGDVPMYTSLFGCTFVSMQIIDMMSFGLAVANKAIGKIGWYTVITFTPKLLILPAAWIALNHGFMIWSVCFVMIGIEFISMLLRIPLSMKENGFNPREYVKLIFLKSTPPALISVAVCFILCKYIEATYPRVILTFLLSISLFILVAYNFSLESIERKKIVSVIKSILNKFKYLNSK